MTPPAPCPAVVAIKSRSLCKSRLAGMLTPQQRVLLVRSMLDGVLDALAAAASIGRIVVVSPERDTVPAAIEVIGDDGDGLNSALNTARRLLIADAHELVILPADLPLITPSDIDALVERGRFSGFALATDTAGTGTNALYLDARVDFRFQFGPDSCRRHVAEAARLGLGGLAQRPQDPQYPGLHVDIDDADDLTRLFALRPSHYPFLRGTAPVAAVGSGG